MANTENADYPTQRARRVFGGGVLVPEDALSDTGSGASDSAMQAGGGILVDDAWDLIPKQPRTSHGPALNWDQRYITGGADLDTDVGFPVSTIMVDNGTGQFLYVNAANRFVAPFTFGVCFLVTQGSERLRAQWQAPPGITQPAAVAAQQATIIVLERDDLPPSPGYRLDGIAGSNLPQSTVTISDYPTPITPLVSAGNVAAAANNIPLAAAAGKFTWIAGFSVSGLGATAGSVIAVTITGTSAPTAPTWQLTIPAGVGVAITSLIVNFPTPIASSAVNTAITVNVPSFGAGNTQSNVMVWGFQK